MECGFLVGQENEAKPMFHPVELEALLKRAKEILEGSRSEAHGGRPGRARGLILENYILVES